MGSKKIYKEFHKEKPEDLTIYKDHYLNDFEIIRLSNFLTEVEFKIMFVINLSQKLKSFPYRQDFRLPYHMIKEMTGWDKKFVKKYLISLKKKNILVMSQPEQWRFHIPTIVKLLTSEPQEEYNERKKPSNERREFDSLYEKVVLNPQAVKDPLFAGLEPGWENL